METIESYKRTIMRIYRRSFYRGMGSIIAIPGNYFPMPDFSHTNDAAALKRDWDAVGSYINNASTKPRI